MKRFRGCYSVRDTRGAPQIWGPGQLLHPGMRVRQICVHKPDASATEQGTGAGVLLMRV